ncbi:MAG: DUF177 domain-containing protein [Elusimicrobia bacterium]|nr:DUF177 domain-containing protein [Elusimicrobiota bacterium]
MEEKNPFVFSREEIRQKGGLKSAFKPDAALFTDALEKPAVVKNLELNIEFFPDEKGPIILAGALKAELMLECSRCGKPLTACLKENFDEVYEDTVECIDVREAVRETLVLLAPMKILCSDACRGLCPVCGINRNIKTCSCRMPGRNPFAALDDLKKKNGAR